ARSELDAAEAALPPRPLLLAGDVTPEALVRLMASTGGSIALLAPEADALELADGRYSDSARVDELLRAWSGESIRVDRIGREPLQVVRPALTLGLTVQPAALDALRHADVHRGRGLWGRVLWCAPPHGLGSRLTGTAVPSHDLDAAERYTRVVRTLADAGWAATEPQTLALSPDALALIHTYEAEVERQLGDGGRLAATRDHAGKVVGQAGRLAALLELAARAEDGRPLWSAPVGQWAVDGGVRLARALTTHAVHVLAPVVDDEMADQRYLLRRIREISKDGAEITVRDVHRGTADRVSIAEAENPRQRLAELLDGLVKAGCIRLLPVERPGPGRTPSPIVELHPSLRMPRACAPPGTDTVSIVRAEQEVTL
ncbi:MAG: DUF3987 domain-containing protein, partial [Longimicrobiales bacterium]